MAHRMGRNSGAGARGIPGMIGFVIAIGLAALAGCTTASVTTSDGRPMPPEPRKAPVTPKSAEPNRMTLLVPRKGVDADGNGYPDLIRVTAAIFAYPHPTSVEADGEFVFTLYRMGEAKRPDAEPITEWRFDREAAGPHQHAAIYGVCYRFELSLLDQLGTDQMPAAFGDVRGRFEPREGTAIAASDEVRLVRLGGDVDDIVRSEES